MAIPLSLSNVPDATPYIQYVANSGQTVYPYPFPITQDSDLVVVINGVTQNTDSTYSLSGQGNDTGGNVTLDNGSTAGDIVTLYRDIQIERLTQFAQNGGFSSSAFNAEFNNLYLIAQQIEAGVAQCLQVPNTNNPSPTTVLTPGSYAGKYLAFDSKGNPTPAALTSSGALTQSIISGLLTPQTAAEAAVNVVPTNTLYVERDVRRYGFVGDNSHDDTASIVTADSIGGPIFIPYTAAGYKITSTITLHNDVFCEGICIPTTAVGANKPCFIIASPGYGVTRKIVGITIPGSGALRTALINGIRVDCENGILFMCRVSEMNYGWIVRKFSNTFLKCSGNLCNTNMSAYAQSEPTEVNTLTVDGGNWDSALVAAFNLGDTSWSDALPAGNFHGVEVNLIGGLNTDGAPIIADNIGSLNIKGIYMETTNTSNVGTLASANALIVLGGSGDGNIRNVTIGGCFLKTAKYAVKCLSGVQGLTIEPNFLVSISVSALSMSTPLYGVVYRNQVTTGCFANGQESQINFGPSAIADIVWPGFTIEKDFLYNGQQMTVNNIQTKWYPGGIAYNAVNAGSQQINISSSDCVFYTTPATNVAGTMSSNVFTVSTLAQCVQFSGGDRISTNAGGYTFVSSVNYETGAITLQGGSGSSATTLSQAAASVSTTIVLSAIPSSGAYAQGDKVWFTAPTSGAAPGAVCTVAGSPGTWKNMAALS